VDQALTATLGLVPPDHFRYIQKGANVSVGYRPATSFPNTLTALESIGIAEHERRDIFSVLALILHLGNLDVGVDADGHAVCPEGNPQATLCARLLGIPSAGQLLDCLLARQIQAGSRAADRESYTVRQTQQQAVDTRDAFARALYGYMFDSLVRRINQALLETQTGRTRSIAILDIFGFEHFQSNHFEQFCINYANEKLQVGRESAGG
jgi:myosin heavy subunit